MVLASIVGNSQGVDFAAHHWAPDGPVRRSVRLRSNLTNRHRNIPGRDLWQLLEDRGVAERSIQDYIIHHHELDWDALLESWRWLLPDSYTIWLMNRFGDLFLILENGVVLMLDSGMGKVEQVAKDQKDFCDLCEKPEELSDYFAIPLVDAMVASDAELGDGQCYTFRHPPVTGGEYEVSNVAVTEIANHFAGYGKIHEQLRDVPDGRQVELDWKP